jgi:hypothetical protein
MCDGVERGLEGHGEVEFDLKERDRPALREEASSGDCMHVLLTPPKSGDAPAWSTMPWSRRRAANWLDFVIVQERGVHLRFSQWPNAGLDKEWSSGTLLCLPLQEQQAEASERIRQPLRIGCQVLRACANISRSSKPEE